MRTWQRIASLAIVILAPALLVAGYALSSMPMSVSTAYVSVPSFPVAMAFNRNGALTVGEGGIVADTAMTSGATSYTLTTANPPYPARMQLIITDPNSAGVFTCNFTLRGRDQFGRQRSVTYAVTETTSDTAHVWGSFDSITAAGCTAGPSTAGPRMRVGTSSTAALPMPANVAGDVVEFTVNTVNAPTASTQLCTRTAASATQTVIASPTINLTDHSIVLTSGSSGFGTCDGFSVRVWGGGQGRVGGGL